MKSGLFKKFLLSPHEKPLQALNRVYPPREAPYRFAGNLLILLLIAATAMIIITVRDNLIDKKIDTLMDQLFTYTAENGWAVNDVLIEGRSKTSRTELINTINITREDNILKIDLKELKQKIEQLPWVESADIRRSFFPHILHIHLHEKEVLALWQSGSRFYPVDYHGKLINAEFTPHKPLLVIVGRKAPEKIIQLLQMTSSQPDLHQRIKAAVLYSGRRWDIIFDDLENGITVKLPEENMEMAWKKFIKINNQHGLLKRKLTFIDLRYKNKLTVTVGASDSAENDGNKQR